MVTALTVADEQLSRVWRFVATNLSRDVAAPVATDEQTGPFTFSTDEEHALETTVNDGIAAYERALAAAPDDLSEPPDALETHRMTLQRHVVACRKVLVAYRERAKRERLAQCRQSLLKRRPRSIRDGATPSSSVAVGDVTAALKRTRQVLTQEMARVGAVAKVLNDDRMSLQSSQDDYGRVTAELAHVRQQLTILAWQARRDKLWIGAGVGVLVMTVLFIVYERTGLIFV